MKKRMTKEQFGVGWILLTSQPWGRAYRGNTVEATIQLELYYKHVDQANPIVWQAVCEHAAQGDKWPSLSELKASLVNNGGYVERDTRALPSRFQFEEMSWLLKAVWTYAQEHDCTVKAAALEVLPVWLKENPHHEDVGHVAQFLDQARANFGVIGKPGNVRASASGIKGGA